jgi:hemerythrin-like domain-containing protein
MVNMVPCMPERIQQPKSIAETLLVHNLHRGATTLLAVAAARPTAEPAALTEVRDFLVAALRSHHEAEDRMLWPLLIAKSPELAGPMADLTAEHDKLDAGLDALEAASADEAGRAALVAAADAVRELIRVHLEHEEGILFPALRDHVTAQEWQDFADKVVAEAPPVHPHLMVGLIEEFNTREQADLIFGVIPAPVREAMVQQARATVERLG